ncbi:FAD-binding oxidoreductase [Actinoplanes oblitus]|uniref:FAD-binding oxidoreductase n=1 Tax=Actinoplanes oblitus TaxID=3040509 RepID=A0ABY8WEU1_9ACTN|nr:FAD-binding oxidoreductase [Actinoplanes oblitus]WIM95008.1 FAD-binding oxidoreductase [Actinoplanes oblitus]
MPTVSTAAWRALETGVHGRVLRPDQPGFRASSTPFNTRHAAVEPAAVVGAADVADVRLALAWARDTALPIVARGGGHSYGGYSTGSGLVIDLSALDEVSVDASTGRVTIEGGVRTAGVYAALEPHGIAFPLGNGASVGVTGLALGGGTAATSRAFGLTADTMVSTTLLTADGQLLTCDATQNADLFWACRGGGGGNFGINVSTTFQAAPVPDVATFLLLWERAAAPKVLEVMQEVQRRAPREFSARLGVAATAGSDPVVSAVGLHLGPASDLRELLDPVLAVARPVRADIADRTFWQAQSYLLHDTSAEAFAVKTSFVRDPLPADAIELLLSAVDHWPAGTNPDGGGFALFAYGGAVNDVAPADTAYVHREGLFLLSMDTSWTAGDDPATVGAGLRWLAGLREAMTPYVTGGAYQNFIDPDLPDWRTAYYGANYPRLVEIKNRVDPDRVFTFPQAIGT